MALKTVQFASSFNLSKIILPSGEVSRISSLDGLRGFLALGVLFHHYIITYEWKLNDLWIAPESNFLNNIGQSSVALFFMITGYLFLGRLIQSKMNWKHFFVSRSFRIFPLYIVVVLLMLLLVMYATNFRLNSGIESFLKEVGAWLLLQQVVVNSYDATMQITAGVTWTLKYEYLFYMFLPILALLVERKITTFLLVLSVCYFAFNPETIVFSETLQLNTVFFLLFIIGGLVAYVELNYKPDGWLLSIVHYSGTIALLFTLFYFETSYAILPIFLLGWFFLSVILNNSVFGLLKSKNAILLGEVSYSVYLVHGVVLYLIFSVMFPTLINQVEEFVYYLLLSFVVFVVVVLSTITYSRVEKPMIEYGRSLARR